MNFSRNILILTHNYSGGSKIFLDQYVETEFKDCGVYVLKPEGQSQNPMTEPARFILIDYKNPLQTKILNADIPSLHNAINQIPITEVFINHLIHFNVPTMVNWLLNSKLPFTYFIHDYYCVCLNFRLDCQLQFCELSKVHPICRYYLKNLQIWDWRRFWHNFLSSAKEIIAPSAYAASIVKNVYPNLSIKVRPHILTTSLSHTFKPQFTAREKLRITFLGRIAEFKGAEYLLKLNAFVRRENLPVEFVVLGEYVDEVFTGTKEGIIFAGKYKVNELSAQLAEFETSMVAVLSNWAETYCYTASEAILSGYPVMALNIGAHVSRIIKNNCGWIFPFEGRDRGLGELQKFLRFISTPQGRNEILLKAANAVNFKNGME